MIGKIIRKRRKELNLKLKDVAIKTGLDVGHLSHIEKGERNPSYKTLKSICDVLDIPVSYLWNYAGKSVNEEKEEYEYMNYISLNKVPLVDIKDYVEVPIEYAGNIIAVTLKDDSMDKIGKKNDCIFVDLNSPVRSGDIILAKYNKKIFVRKFNVSGFKIKLVAYNKEYSDIKIDEEDDFEIIGKVVELKKTNKK